MLDRGESGRPLGVQPGKPRAQDLSATRCDLKHRHAGGIDSPNTLPVYACHTFIVSRDMHRMRARDREEDQKGLRAVCAARRDRGVGTTAEPPHAPAGQPAAQRQPRLQCNRITETWAEQSELDGIPKPIKFSGISPGFANTKRLWHCTGETGARAVAAAGFLLRGDVTCMFGSGIYFAASADIARKKAWHGRSQGCVIEALVELGRCWEVTTAHKELDSAILNGRVPGHEGTVFDSVWARPKSKGGPMAEYDEVGRSS